MTHEKDKLPDVVNEVGKRLVRIKRLEAAADLYESVGQYDTAVKCCIQIENYEKAKQIASQVRDRENYAKLMDFIDRS